MIVACETVLVMGGAAEWIVDAHSENHSYRSPQLIKETIFIVGKT